MPNRKYESGRRLEYKVRDKYRRQGYLVMRAAGSKSPFDLVAVDPLGMAGTGLIHFIQVKSVKKGTLAQANRMGRKFLDNPPLGKPPLRRFAQALHVRYGREMEVYVC